MAENSHQPESVESGPSEPTIDQVYKFLMYGLTLPERTIRSTAAVVTGAVSESVQLLVPRAFQDSKTYQVFVQQMLDMLAKDVGGVGAEEAAEKEKLTSSEPIASEPNSSVSAPEAEPEIEDKPPEVSDYVARKTVSTFVDFAGMATMHLSPLTILAIVSDIAYGSQTYLTELADELKREGVISENSTINNTADLLKAIGNASSDAADTMDLPPVSVDGLKETIEKTQQNLLNIDPTKIIPMSEIDAMWNDMSTIASEENVNVFSVSSAITMYTLQQIETIGTGTVTTLKVTGNLVDRHLFDHYRQGINQIYQKGLFVMIGESSEPYFDAVWYNFSAERPTITEDVLSGRMVERIWSGMTGWFSTDPATPDSDSAE